MKTPKLFSRAAEKTEVTPSEPSFVEGRSWNGTAFHLLDPDNADAFDALCGYDVLNRGSTLTVSEIRQALPQQHAGWRYCKDCLGAAGIS